MDPERVHPETVAAQALGHVDERTGAIVPPLHVSSTFLRDPDNAYRTGRVYARADSPAFDAPEAVIAALEGGSEALVFASGMAAATACFQALAPGDHVVAPTVMYWALRSWLAGFATRWGLDVTFADAADPAALRAALRPGRTRLVWIETPANPLWTLTDIGDAAEAAHAAGALLAVDSTVATPVLTRPLALGADVVMHSATKYLNGHGDLVAGALVAREDGPYWQAVRAVRAQVGGTLGSFESWLLTRGLRTLHLRVRAASASALALASRLEGSPHVREVLYPGLPTFPGHEVACRQMTGGFGGMLSIRVAGGEEAAIATAAGVRLWKRATSLGGAESLIEHRASVEGAGTPAPPDLLRLSVGLEHVDDLAADLEQALAAAHEAAARGRGGVGLRRRPGTGGAMEAQAASPRSGRWEFELYDLSRPLTRETVVALFGDIVADGANPYFTDIAVETPFDYATGTTRASIVRIPDHVGTHVDAPLHMVEGGPSLERMDLSRLIGEAVVLDLEVGDVDHGYTAAELEAAAPGVEPGDIVLIYSGYVDAVEHRRMRQTYLTEEAALWLVERGVKAVGCEPSGIEHTPQGLFELGWYRKDAEHPWPAHRALLANDVYIVEGLTNLRPLRGQRVRFAALPVAMPGLTGFSVRAVAWVDR